jgi:DHA1 family multidrug resistance protein-like MFS transporter
MNKEQRTVLVLSAIIYLVMTGVTMISPILPQYGDALGATIPMVGFLVAGFAIARVFLSLPAGIFGDRIGNKTTMSIGLAIISLSSLIAYSALAFHQTFQFGYAVLMTARVLEGAGSAFYATMSTSYLAKNTSIEHRGRYMSIFVGALLLGQVSGPGIGGFVAINYGINAPFLFYGTVTGIGFLVHVLLIEKDRGIPREELAQRNLRGDIRKVFSNRSFIIVNLGTLAAFFARGGIIATLFPIMANKNFGLDTSMIGLVLTGVAVTSLITMLLGGALADKYGRKLPFFTSMILGGISVLFIPFAWDLTSLALTMLIFGLSLGLSGPMAAWAADLSEPRTMGTAMGVYRTIGDAGFILGPVILTAVATLADPNTISSLPFFVCFFWLVITGLILLKAEDPAGKKVIAGPAF